MNIVKMIFGMIKWKKNMKKMKDMPAYTDEWWAACEKELQFMGEDTAKQFLDGAVLMGILY